MPATNDTLDTEITTDPTVPTIRIVREFDAPPQRVFRAHADPALLTRWYGMAEQSLALEPHDCRTGGTYRPQRIDQGNNGYPELERQRR